MHLLWLVFGRYSSYLYYPGVSWMRVQKAWDAFVYPITLLEISFFRNLMLPDAIHNVLEEISYHDVLHLIRALQSQHLKLKRIGKKKEQNVFRGTCTQLELHLMIGVVGVLLTHILYNVHRHWIMGNCRPLNRMAEKRQGKNASLLFRKVNWNNLLRAVEMKIEKNTPPPKV